jgi:hypothetical protein
VSVMHNGRKRYYLLISKKGGQLHSSFELCVLKLHPQPEYFGGTGPHGRFLWSLVRGS